MLYDSTLTRYHIHRNRKWSGDCQGLGGGKNEESLFVGYRGWGKMKRLLETDGGGCTTM